LEWFTQYRVRFLETRRAYVKTAIEKLSDEIKDAEGKTLEAEDQKRVDRQKQELAGLVAERDAYHEGSWNALSDSERVLHQKGFVTNTIDPDYRTLAEHDYDDYGTARKTGAPKGDVLAQFRKDVQSGNLPAVTWLVAPERFSDHPGSAWFGAWYVSETLHILTENPEVWKKTVFILCYDENDGYFDHVPPFVAPHPGRPETGRTSGNLDTAVDVSDAHGRDHSIGLGFRVPLLIASPWSRGGAVNSQVCDHTSIIMFVEEWLAGKGKPVRETNVSDWRRTVCGDLTSAFRPYRGEKVDLPQFLDRDAYIERIHKASFKHFPKPADTLSSTEIEKFAVSAFQEHGSRPSCPLPYRLEAAFEPSSDGVKVTMSSGKKVGSAFNLYIYGPKFEARAFAVRAGDTLEEQLPGSGTTYRLDGPNGFIRELSLSGPGEVIAVAKQKGKELELELRNRGASPVGVRVSDLSYGQPEKKITLPAGGSRTVRLSTEAGKRWYDYSVAAGSSIYRFAGRLETGEWGETDPSFA
jgi:phospholipase C